MQRELLILAGKLTALIVAVLLVLGGLLFSFCYFFPGGAFKVFKWLYVPKEYAITWSSIEWQAKKKEQLSFDFQLKIKQATIERKSPILLVSGDLNVKGSLTLWSPSTDLLIEELKVGGPQSRLIYEGSATPQDKNYFEQLMHLRLKLIEANDWITMRRLEVVFADGQVLGSGPEPLPYSLSVVKPGKGGPDSMDWSVAATVNGAKWNLSGLIWPERLAQDGTFLKSKVEVNGSTQQGQGTLDFDLANQLFTSKVKFDGQFGDRSSPIRTSFGGKVTMDRSQINLEGKFGAENLAGDKPPEQNMTIKMNAPLTPGRFLSRSVGRVEIKGPLSMSFLGQKMIRDIEKNCKCTLVKQVLVELAGSIWFESLMRQEGETEEKVVADLKFKSENINNPLFSSSLEGELRVIYKETGYHFVPTVNADFEILSFKAFSGLLADNGLTVPAPLNVLEGKIHVGVHTTLEDSPTGMTVPMQITALLKSQLQKLDVLANVRATIQSSRKSAMVLVNIKVNDLVLELPPLDPIRGIPKIGEDSRMKTAGEAAKETSTPEGFKVGFVYDVKTVDPDGVRLLSRLAVPHIPLSVDFTRNLAGSTTGNLRIMPFELRYLHRRIEVDHMRVILDDRDTADYAVDGRLRVNNNPSYKIQIEISGTIRSPSVKLTSEPELSRPDIISVILYGRTNDQLVQADREIVGSFDAAVADRAIGLLGLWAFSSTPIQSFSYNPLTKVYAASVQVAEGTTASIGTDWEEAAQLEVRKHVTKRWVLTATYSPAQSAASQSGKLTLQWEKRF